MEYSLSGTRHQVSIRVGLAQSPAVQDRLEALIDQMQGRDAFEYLLGVPGAVLLEHAVAKDLVAPDHEILSGVRVAAYCLTGRRKASGVRAILDDQATLN